MVKRGSRYLLMVMLLVLSVPAHAQSNFAIVTGTVTDAQQLPVVGASVE
jgi:hypothetical protein